MSEFEGRTIRVIIGGTGSFRDHFPKNFLDRNFKEIRAVSRDELKQEQMRLRLENPKVKFYSWRLGLGAEKYFSFRLSDR